MKKLASLFLVCLFLFCCSSTEKPEPPKPTAQIDFDIEDSPFNIYKDYWKDVLYIDIYIVIYETAGVSVNISVVKTEWWDGQNSIASSLSQGGYLQGSGSLRVHIYSEFPAKYRPGRMGITVSGKDVNGHNIEKFHDYTFTWNSATGSPKFARR
jgi:hypothetical protein